MHIVNWKEGTTRGYKPTFNKEDSPEVMFRMLGISEKDHHWQGNIVQTKKLHPDGDVKNAFYAELRSDSKTMGQDLPGSRWYGQIRVSIGFAPKVGDEIPANLKEKEAVDYPVVIKTWGACKMSQDDMFVLSLAIRESTSILVQMHQDEKNIPKVTEDELVGG